MTDGHIFGGKAYEPETSGPVIKCNFYLLHLHLTPRWGWFHRNFVDDCRYLLHKKTTESLGYRAALSVILHVGPSRFGTNPACDRRTRDDSKYSTNIALHRQNLKACSTAWPWRCLKVIRIASWIGHISLAIRSALVTTTLYLTPFPRNYHIYSLHHWLWPWEVLRFQKESLNYNLQATCTFRFRCKNIVDNMCCLLCISRVLRDRKVSNSE